MEFAPERTIVGVVIDVPEPYADEILQWRMGFGDPYSDRMPTHITLLPPTPMSPRAAGNLAQSLESALSDIEPFEVTLGPVGTFRPTSPVVFLHASATGQQLFTLEERVRQITNEPQSRHEFVPHCTLAMKVGEGLLDAAAAALADYSCTWLATHLSLYHRGANGRWLLESEHRLGH